MDTRSRIRKHHRRPLNCHAIVNSCIRHKRCRILICRQTRTTIGDGNDRAVLVHLPVTEEVEPRPREESFARWGVGGDRDGRRHTVDETTTDVAEDDGPGRAEIVGHGDLARPAAVRGRAGDGVVYGRASVEDFDRAHAGQRIIDEALGYLISRGCFR